MQLTLPIRGAKILISIFMCQVSILIFTAAGRFDYGLLTKIGWQTVAMWCRKSRFNQWENLFAFLKKSLSLLLKLFLHVMKCVALPSVYLSIYWQLSRRWPPSHIIIHIEYNIEMLLVSYSWWQSEKLYSSFSNFELSTSWAAKLWHIQYDASRRKEFNEYHLRTFILDITWKVRNHFCTAIIKNVLEYSTKNIQKFIIFIIPILN